MKDYNGTEIAVGDAVRSIECGWRGEIQSTYDDSGITMLICIGINWWTKELDTDDVQHFAAADVLRCERTEDAPINATNFM